MRRSLYAAIAAFIVAATSLAACGKDETVVRRETYTYAPQPTPVIHERTVIERHYE